MLINFCDSCFAIGESYQDKSFRYLKQIKVRNAEIKYDSENVLLCQISKDSNFLKFVFERYDSERKHLRMLSDSDRDNLIEQAKSLSASGKSQREIAQELGISLTSVNRYLKK